MLIQLWRTSQLGIDVGRPPTHDAYCQISARADVQPNHQRVCRLRLSSGHAGSQLTTHWSSPKTDFITVFTSSPTLRRLPVPEPTRRAYFGPDPQSSVDCLVIMTVRQYGRPPLCWLTTADRRSLIHIFGTWLSSSTTCHPIIHQAPTAGRLAVHVLLTILSTRIAASIRYETWTNIPLGRYENNRIFVILRSKKNGILCNRNKMILQPVVVNCFW